MSKWINIEDRFPSETGYYLTYTPNAKYKKINVQSFLLGVGWHKIKMPTHWKYLPEPPKEAALTLSDLEEIAKKCKELKIEPEIIDGKSYHKLRMNGYIYLDPVENKEG